LYVVSPITLETKFGCVGSNDKLFQDSKITGLFVVSSPLLTTNENTPDAVLLETTCHLTLSILPFSKAPPVKIVPLLFQTAPLSIASKVTAVLASIAGIWAFE